MLEDLKVIHCKLCHNGGLSDYIHYSILLICFSFHKFCYIAVKSLAFTKYSIVG